MYITVRQKAYEHQLTWDDIMDDVTSGTPWGAPGCIGTITRIVFDVPQNAIDKANIPQMIAKLQSFVSRYDDLYKAKRSDLYRTFFIPKNSGGLRRIDAPHPPLMDALRELKNILEMDCGALYHTSAFAYVKQRCCVDAVKKHQRNESNWFLKLDFKDFFGSTTPEFLFRMVAQSFPFCEIVKNEQGREALLKALDLCFLNGGLPQGTPISPTLTNIMMIPIDHRIFNTLAKRKIVYTRYADDLLISAVESFSKDKMSAFVNQVLSDMRAPFRINDAKTRYGSRKGSNWNLGVMLNKDNNITVGHMKKKHFKAALCNLICDAKNGKRWPPEEIQTLRGQLSFYRSVEPDYFNYVIRHMTEKFRVNVEHLLKEGCLHWFET